MLRVFFSQSFMNNCQITMRLHPRLHLVRRIDCGTLCFLIIILLSNFISDCDSEAAVGHDSMDSEAADSDMADSKLGKFIKYYEPLNLYLLPSRPSLKKRFAENDQPKSLDLSFTAFGQCFNIFLYHHSRVFAKDATVQVISSEGLKSNTTVDTSHLYQGYVHGDPASHVHGYVLNDTFNGIIKTRNESYHLEPAWYYFNVTQPFRSVIYKQSDVIFPTQDQGADNQATKSSDVQGVKIDDYDAILSFQQQKYVPFDAPIKDKDIFASLHLSNKYPVVSNHTGSPSSLHLHYRDTYTGMKRPFNVSFREDRNISAWYDPTEDNNISPSFIQLDDHNTSSSSNPPDDHNLSPPSNALDDHNISPSSNPLDDHNISSSSIPPDDHNLSPPSNALDDHKFSPSSNPLDDHNISSSSIPPDDHNLSPPSNALDDHKFSPSSNPLDDHNISSSSIPPDDHNISPPTTPDGQNLQPASNPLNDTDQQLSSNPQDDCDKCYTALANVRTCSLHIVIDHTFFLAFASDVMRALAEVAYHIEEADNVYRATDFNGDGIGDNVGLSISDVTIFESHDAENYLLSGNINDADDYLSLFSLYNFDAYCLGVAFASVDFVGGVLGLAWIGYADHFGPPGGICEQRVIYREDGLPSSLNTGLVTTINYGSKVPRQVTSVTVMHEIGHLFGSLHDPPTPECAPSGNYGNYIMFAKATDGDKPFNTLLSPCSTAEMAPVIAAKGPLCFQFYTGPYCGNQIVEDGEECDCGTAAQCSLVDRCCTPQGGMATDGECTFRREHGYICSPYSSSCCTKDCKLIAASAEHVCVEETECVQQSLCNGESTECPEPMPKPNGTHCSSGKTCLNGMCQLSICSTLGLLECLCVHDVDLMCHICCQGDGDCSPVSSISSALNKSSMLRPAGSACNNYTGYCDWNGNCIVVDSDSALHRLRDLFSSKGVSNIAQWMQINWYYIVAVVLGVVLISSLIKVIQYHIPTRASRITERAARLSSVWREARRQKAKIAEERQKVMNMPGSHISIKTGLAGPTWLGQLFPSATKATVRETAQSCSSEREAVLKLLSEGYGMKKIKIPDIKI